MLKFQLSFPLGSESLALGYSYHKKIKRVFCDEWNQAKGKIPHFLRKLPNKTTLWACSWKAPHPRTTQLELQINFLVS